MLNNLTGAEFFRKYSDIVAKAERVSKLQFYSTNKIIEDMSIEAITERIREQDNLTRRIDEFCQMLQESKEK